MKNAAVQLPLTAAEYLEGERHATERHEFVDGRVYAMSGASRRHNDIAFQATSLLKNHFADGPCRAYIEAVKVQLADDFGEAYYYPDVVTCEDSDDDSHIVSEPRVIIEVLSETTSRNDRGDKLTNYKRIPSVQEIVLIEQDWPEIVVFRRDNKWRAELHTQMDTQVALPSIDFKAPVSTFYASAPLPDDVKRPWYHRNRIED